MSVARVVALRQERALETRVGGAVAYLGQIRSNQATTRRRGTEMGAILTDDELEEQLAHSAAGAKHATLHGVVGSLMARAGDLFAMGHDQLATEVRALANRFDKERKEAATVLDGHIARSISQSARNEPSGGR